MMKLKNLFLNQEVKLWVLSFMRTGLLMPKKDYIKLLTWETFWEEKTGYPIPLGGIVGKKSIDENILMKVDALIKQSIEYAFKNYPLITEYVRIHSRKWNRKL